VAAKLGVSEDEMDVTFEECAKKTGLSMEKLVASIRECAGIKT